VGKIKIGKFPPISHYISKMVQE